MAIFAMVDHVIGVGLYFFLVDITVYHRGFHGDLNETFFVGDQVSEDKRKLVQVTYECLQQAIDMGKHFVVAYSHTCVFL